MIIDFTKKQESALAAFKAARLLFQQQRFSDARAKSYEYKALINYHDFATVDRRPEKLPTCTAIIVIHNGSQDVFNCIDTLLSQKEGQSLEVIIVDNGHNEQLEECLKKRSILYIHCPINFLPSEGRNVGAAFSRAPLLLFIDDDGLPCEDYISQAILAMSNTSVMGVRGRVLSRSKDGAVSPHYDLGEKPRGEASFNLEGNMVIRRHIFRAVGGFDPLMFGHEGHELAERCRRLKPHAQINYWPGLVLKHDFAVGDRLVAKRERQTLGEAYRHWLKMQELPIVSGEPVENKMGTSLVMHLDPETEPVDVIEYLEPLAEKSSSEPTEVLLLIKAPFTQQQAIIRTVVKHFLGRLSIKVLPATYWLLPGLVRFSRYSKMLLVDEASVVAPFTLEYCLELFEIVSSSWLPVPLQCLHSSQRYYGSLMSKENYLKGCQHVNKNGAVTLQVFSETLEQLPLETYQQLKRQLAKRKAQQHLAQRQHLPTYLVNRVETPSNRIVHTTEYFRDEDLTAWHPPVNKTLKIAFIGSEVLFDKLATVVETVDLMNRQQLADEEITAEPNVACQFDLLLVESQLLSSGQKAYEDTCRQWALAFQKAGVPCCFWYTEPVHHLYLIQELATVFDHVATVEQESAIALQYYLEKQSKALPVSVLGPCVAPALDNAIRQFKKPSFKNLHVLYDGWADLIEFQENRLLIETLKRDDLLVADASWQFNQLKLKDIPGLEASVLGYLTPHQRRQALKEFNVVLLTSRTLKSSAAMRQEVLEALAAKAHVIVYLHENDTMTFGELDPYIEYHREADVLAHRLETLKTDLWQCKSRVQPGWRRVHQQHNIQCRLAQWLKLAGVDKKLGEQPLISCLTVTKRPQWLHKIIDNYLQQEYPNKELLIALNTDQVDRQAIAREVQEKVPSAQIFQFGSERNLGFCLNWLIRQSQGAYWAKMDDDDSYGPNYLMDYWLNTQALDSDLVGKKMSATYFEALDKTLYRDSDTLSASDFILYEGNHHHMAGATFFAKRDLLNLNPFSESRRSSIDVEFFRGALQKEQSVMLADDFNFTVYRAADKQHHTWKEDDAILMNKARELSSQQVNV
ncbi:glycosyltransferase [Halomonas sp. LS-001]